MAAPGPIQRMLSLFRSFTSGFRMVDGQELRDLVNSLFGTRTGLVAGSGGSFGAATALEGTTMVGRARIATVAAAGDSVLLPYPIQGRRFVVFNDGANSAQVMSPNGATGGSSIITAGARTTAPTAGNVGVALPSGATMRLECFDTDAWKVLT